MQTGATRRTGCLVDSMAGRGALMFVAVVLVAAMGVSTAQAEINTMLTLHFTNLATLDEGVEGHYEGWAIVGGMPISTGVFNVNAMGQPVELGGGPVINEFMTGMDLSMATAIKITIEPAGDADPAPSGLVIVGGPVSGMDAALTTGLESVDAATCAYFLATPSDNPDMPDNNDHGIWFLTMPGPEPGFMNLPDIGPNWTYEGWVVDISGSSPVPYSTGKFSMATGADSDAAGPMGGGPPFPGQDFVAFQGGPVLDLDTGDFAAVITVEPVPDNLPSPFQLKPFAGMIPTDALGMNNMVGNQTDATFPTGDATLNNEVPVEQANWGSVKALYR